MERNLPILDKMLTATLYTFVAFSMFSISITQIACGLGGLLWVIRTHITGTWKEQIWPLKIPFILFVLACLVAVGNAYDLRYSFESLKKLLEILIFFWVVNCVRDNRLRDSLSLVLIAFATLASLYGFYQAWRDDATAWSRVEGTMSVYMTFAGLLMIVGIHTFGRIIFRKPAHLWLWVPFGIISICLLLTLTRQAWFGFATGLILLIFVWRKKYLLFVPVLIATLILVSPAEIKFRLKSMVDGKDTTFAIRKALWQGGWNVFKDYPLTGCGFRCMDLVAKQYPDPTGHIKYYRGMHNNFIQFAVDTGILGLSAWLGIWICFFRLLYQRISSLEEDPSDQWVLWGSLASVIAFLAGGCFESNYYDSEVAMVLFFLMALPFSSSQSKKSH
jgi:O-antigen ligase